MQAKIVLEWNSTSTLDSVVEMEVYNDLKRQRDRWSSRAQKLILSSLIPAVARHKSLSKKLLPETDVTWYFLKQYETVKRTKKWIHIFLRES